MLSSAFIVVRPSSVKVNPVRSRLIRPFMIEASIVRCMTPVFAGSVPELPALVATTPDRLETEDGAPRSPRACSPQNGSVTPNGDHLCFLRSFLPRRITVPSPCIPLQKMRVLSQIPVDVLGTMWEAARRRFLCLEATSLLCTTW
jgi:hypothetical protein